MTPAKLVTPILSPSNSPATENERQLQNYIFIIIIIIILFLIIKPIRCTNFSNLFLE